STSGGVTLNAMLARVGGVDDPLGVDAESHHAVGVQQPVRAIVLADIVPERALEIEVQDGTVRGIAGQNAVREEADLCDTAQQEFVAPGADELAGAVKYFDLA